VADATAILDTILRQARRDRAVRDDLRDNYRQHRPLVERSIAWLIGPRNRCRQLRHRGTAKGSQRLHLRMAGLNLRRMISLELRPRAGGGWIIPGAA
jgi:Transposase DDE domain